ncbi:YolD-like family protein [Litchfieldia alkalitelluris]|uniref:YolD-like family protein n=1 Tax=Litchfieldia alkalitelluris TaxID=304268 RepID=UPI00099640E3|nr:YolD-like family protein [Litchfieldia alkalitelluris]
MNDRIRDRGSIKWTAMMMPEHVTMIRKHFKDEGKQVRPVLDADQIEEFERLLKVSLAEEALLEVTTWIKGYFSKRVGVVKKINPHQKKVVFEDELNNMFAVEFMAITDVKLI